MARSFGNQKQHYGVSRIAARNKDTETLQLFFAIHIANAATLAERRRRKEEKLRKNGTPHKYAGLAGWRRSHKHATDEPS